MTGDNHLPFIHEAIALSQSADAQGDEPFGALLVHAARVILRAENSVRTGHDITQHAEMNLVRHAVAQFPRDVLEANTLYTSTEPCTMCAGAIYWSRIGRVVFACSEMRLREITGGSGLRLACREVFARVSRAVDLIDPLLEDEAAAIHLAYRVR